MLSPACHKITLVAMVWCANLVFTINMGQKLIKLFPLEGRGTVGAEPVLLNLIIPATVLRYVPKQNEI